ncbi:MAG: hypothetical protein U0V56_03760 [Actinomycetota bacterium]
MNRSERLLSGPFDVHTRATVKDPGVLRRQLTEVSAQGYAQTLEELEDVGSTPSSPPRSGAPTGR